MHADDIQNRILYYIATLQEKQGISKNWFMIRFHLILMTSIVSILVVVLLKLDTQSFPIISKVYFKLYDFSDIIFQQCMSCKHHFCKDILNRWTFIKSKKNSLRARLVCDYFHFLATILYNNHYFVKHSITVTKIRENTFTFKTCLEK